MAHASLDRCIEECNDCAVECEHCATACLNEDGVSMLARCIALNRDCADICRLAVVFMARGSEFSSTICGICATICRVCGDECAKHSQMEHCRRCADSCYRCAGQLEQYAAAGTIAQSMEHK